MSEENMYKQAAKLDIQAKKTEKWTNKLRRWETENNKEMLEQAV